VTLVPTNVVSARGFRSVVNANVNTPRGTNSAAVRESDLPIGCFPVVVDNLLLHADATGVYATELTTGKPAITPKGDLYEVDAPARVELGPGGQRIVVAAGVPRQTLTVVDGIVFARVGRIETAAPRPAPPPVSEVLIGLDLRRDGLLTFQARPDDERWSFEGAPVGDGRRIYIAMRHADVNPHAYVSCYDVATGRRIWRTAIGSADTLATGEGAEITHNLLSLDGDRIYFNTNLGLVAALRTTDGRIEWLHRYERHAGGAPEAIGANPLHCDRDPSPCLVQSGIVVVAPSDTPNVMAFDADTGRQIWLTDQLADALHLLGVVDGRLVVTGNRFWSVDLRTGEIRVVWPESDHAGIRGMGRGVVAGDEVFWPTRQAIYVLDARNGARTRAPIDLSYVGGQGANLIAARDCLVVAGRERLLATGQTAPKPPAEPRSTPRVANSN
jgi:outer membrane protein assembly factor BamB